MVEILNTMKLEKITPQILSCYCGSYAQFYGASDYWTMYSVGVSGAVVLKNGLHTQVVHEDNLSIEYDLHLRRLESITEDEAKELFAIESDDKFVNSIYHESYTNFGLGFSDEKEWALDSFLQPRFFSPEQFLYLLSRGFDLFNLIDAGLAKEITT